LKRYPRWRRISPQQSAAPHRSNAPHLTAAAPSPATPVGLQKLQRLGRRKQARALKLSVLCSV